MAEKKIDPKFNIYETYTTMNILNPYRFGVNDGLGSETVVNGSFDSSDISGWTPLSGAQLSWDSGRLKISTSGSDTFWGAKNSHSFEPGSDYQLSFDIEVPPSSVNITVYGSGDGAKVFNITESGSYSYLIPNVTSILEIVLKTSSGFTGAFWLDNVSIRKVL